MKILSKESVFDKLFGCSVCLSFRPFVHLSAECSSQTGDRLVRRSCLSLVFLALLGWSLGRACPSRMSRFPMHLKHHVNIKIGIKPWLPNLFEFHNKMVQLRFTDSQISEFPIWKSNSRSSSNYFVCCSQLVQSNHGSVSLSVLKMNSRSRLVSASWSSLINKVKHLFKKLSGS